MCLAAAGAEGAGEGAPRCLAGGDNGDGPVAANFMAAVRPDGPSVLIESLESLGVRTRSMLEGLTAAELPGKAVDDRHSVACPALRTDRQSTSSAGRRCEGEEAAVGEA